MRLDISHNLNVIYQVSDRVGVMYLGKMVEMASFNQLYTTPLHPYTEALLSAIPQVDVKNRSKRIILEGDVPNPINPPAGCRFHPRCGKVFERCYHEEPLLKKIESGQVVACHLY